MPHFATTSIRSSRCPGVQLPSKYLIRERKSLSLLLGPGMTGMWVISSLLVWGLVPDLSFLHALAVAACITPTDPVLSNSIVKGQFADQNIPRDLQRIIVAESGANDGLGYPFLFFALYVIKYVGGGHGRSGWGDAMKFWFVETWFYTIIMSVAFGAVIGYTAQQLLHWAEERKFVDRESFLVFAITLALFVVGTGGMLGTDDVLACFIAGNAFTWDDWFRLETLDDSFQPTLDMLLNLSVFMWFGAVCPWYSFVHNDVISIARLIGLGILILLLRRLPVITLLHKQIWQIDAWQEMLYTGFFGPIGVSAIFYLYIGREFLGEITVDRDGVEEVRPDAAKLAEVLLVVVWFMSISSIVVHGLSVPLGKLGYHVPRRVADAVSSRASARQSTSSFQLEQSAVPSLNAVAVSGQGQSVERQDDEPTAIPKDSAAPYVTGASIAFDENIRRHGS